MNTPAKQFTQQSQYNRRHSRGSVKPKGRYIYVKFQYRKETIEYATKELATPENIAHWEEWLDNALDAIDAGRFVYSSIFPDAKPERLALFARLEGESLCVTPDRVNLGEYIKKYRDEIVRNFTSRNLQKSYTSKINNRILPYFEDMSFKELNSNTVAKFMGQLNQGGGEFTSTNLKKTLSRNTISDIITVLRAIWNSGSDEYNFDLRDPFREVKKYLPPAKRKNSKLMQAEEIPAWRYDEAISIIETINPFYKNVTILMFLTGMSASEIAGIRKRDVLDDELLVVNFITENSGESDEGKSAYRTRAIPLNNAIRNCLNEAMESTQDEYLFHTASGATFTSKRYYENWQSALKRAGLEYVRPYSTRHTFAVWSLLAGTTPEQLANLMGHGSKQMVYEVYGKWKKHLEKDIDEICQFMKDGIRS